MLEVQQGGIEFDFMLLDDLDEDDDDFDDEEENEEQGE